MILMMMMIVLMIMVLMFMLMMIRMIMLISIFLVKYDDDVMDQSACFVATCIDGLFR